MFHSPETISPLPQYWPFGKRHRNQRITTLPHHYLAWALRVPTWPPAYRAALRAAEGLRTLDADQAGGRP